MSRSRSFCYTWNNYPEGHGAILDQVQCRYIIYGREVGESGTPHLQGYVYFINAKTVQAVRRILPGCHIEIARGSFAQNHEYCSKQGDFVARGEPPMDDRERGQNERDRYDQAWNLAVAGRIDEIDADIRLRHYSTICKIQRDYMAPVANLESVCGIWIHGASGCGKTRSALGSFPQAFIKPRNIWWDGYQAQEVVICDDVDKYDVKLGGQFKHWADYPAFIGECKGGSRRIRPSKFIVTSQYTIDEIWIDQETRDALNRRFVSIHKCQGQDIILI